VDLLPEKQKGIVESLHRQNREQGELSHSAISGSRVGSEVGRSATRITAGRVSREVPVQAGLAGLW
jgi:hypothetical protein